MTSVKFFVLACGVAIGMSACGGGGGSADYQNGATYTEALSGDPGNLHPLRAVQQSTFRLIPFAYDSLINLDSKGRVVSQLAEKWEATATKATYTLRPGITCSDGAKLTASDVADNFKWVKDPANKSTVIGSELPSADFTVAADDAARTVTLEVAQPYSFLLQSAGLIPIVCPNGLKNPKSLAHGTDGTGPFKLTDYVADDHLTLVARKDYRWGPGGATTQTKGFPAKVVLKIIQDESTLANLLLSGQLSAASIQGPDRKRLQGQGFQEITQPDGPSEIFFNQRRGHFTTDPDVRKALVMGLDLPPLMKVVTQNSGELPNGLAILVPRKCQGDSVTGAVPKHDPEGAKTLLDEAGWTEGSDGIRAKDGHKLAVTLLYPSQGAAVSSGMELIAQWWKDLGVDVKIAGKDINATQQALFAGNVWDVAWLDVGLPFPNQFMPFATGPASPAGQNFAAIRNPEYDRIANQALKTSGSAGCDLWQESEQTLFKHADVVPAAANTTVTFVKDARLAIGVDGTEPTSIRMLAH